jgi:hypothetical protein
VTQVAAIKALIPQALEILNPTLCFCPMYAAALHPGRIAAWLEGAAQLEVPQGQLVIDMVVGLLAHRLPYADNDDEEEPAQPLPGCEPGANARLVSAWQWREGAMQLRREVRY